MTTVQRILKVKIKRYYLRINKFFREINVEPVKIIDVTNKDIIAAEKDFERIYKIIDSCENYQQLDCARNSVHLLAIKHPFTVVIEKVLEQKIINKEKEFYIS